MGYKNWKVDFLIIGIILFAAGYLLSYLFPYESRGGMLCLLVEWLGGVFMFLSFVFLFAQFISDKFSKIKNL